MIERDRLLALFDYVVAAESDGRPKVADMADYKGLRRDGAEIAALPGIALDLRDGDGNGDGDACWLSVDRLTRRPPPPTTDAALRPWLIVPDDVASGPSLRAELVREVGGGAPAEVLRLDEHRARLEPSLEGYRRELWTPWVADERPRRRTIDLYNALFALRQTLSGGAEQPVELVWGIGIARRTVGAPGGTAPRLNHPLLTVPVEVTMNERSHAIEVRPRSEVPPAIESAALDGFDPQAVDDWTRGARRHLDALEGDGLSPFDPSSHEFVLRRAAQLLDPDGRYLPDLGEEPRPPEGTLHVDGNWVLIERRRAATALLDDLRRFREDVEKITEVAALPQAVRVLLEPPADAPREESYPAYRGVSTVPGVTSADGSGADLFFPKPFNREQVEVIQRLATRPGVVVQGPPGTGKTHTIANIICHYLALGKRVLVTSQKAPALKVLRDKLPPAVRPLAVSLLDSDRDGLKLFQESVDAIASRLQHTRPGEVARQIAALDARIEASHRALAAIDRQIEDVGRAAMTAVVLDGVTHDPAAAARRVHDAGELADWLPDAIDTEVAHEPGFDDEGIARLRRARKAAGARLAALGDKPLPALPDAATVGALHDRLIEAADLGQRTAAHALREGATSEAVAALLVALETLATAIERAATNRFAWSADVLARWRDDGDQPVLAAMLGLAGEADALAGEARHFIVRPVVVPQVSEPDLREAIATLARGEELGLLRKLFGGALKAQLASVRLAGRAPANAGEWSEVERHLLASDRATQLVAQWNHASAQGGLDAVDDAGLPSIDAIRRQIAQLLALRAVAADEIALTAEARALMPGWRERLGADPAALSALTDLLDRHLRLARLSSATAELAALRARIAGVDGALGDQLGQLAGCVGAARSDASTLTAGWTDALDEADALRALAPVFADIRHLASLIAQGGAPLWAERLRSEPVTGVEDPLTPGDWRERWTLRRLATWLDRIDGHGRLRALAGERRAAEETLARAYEESIELRTWCRLAEKASDQVRSALASYAQAMRKLGRGTGIRAGRHLADARAASERAKNALPCWIMPHARVSESLPAELGLFDLVVIDEASQSTVAALPALLRAKQVLIVGDDRQVSPDAGFRAEEAMNARAARHLSTQVEDYRSALREDRSLYDLGTVVFAGGAILLKEHFRCVAPIIEYSKAQFYGHQIVPLRLPAASERLDPPLVDILVEDGHRTGKVNPPEVDCIVAEIGRIADDPAMAGRSIGVTTLLGHEQAIAIQTAIEQVLGTETMLRHDIRVGEPAAFQGDERDIMFVSMVADRGSSGLSGLGFEQRFNVAASRARDRMVLVRSVELEDLRPTDKLRRSLIEHFAAPFAGESSLTQDRRKRCESPFESEMYDLLVERGYRVDTQVPVGAKRIDLVVEGSDDRRLAIECDGDRWHGPEQWPDDMARQRVLERAGWTVWRCFASRFVRDRRGVIDELVGVLAERGIVPETGPGAGDALPPSRHTEHRRWRSAPVDAAPVPHAWLVAVDGFVGT